MIRPITKEIISSPVKGGSDTPSRDVGFNVWQNFNQWG
jgi:hypothetical protein